MKLTVFGAAVADAEESGAYAAPRSQRRRTGFAGIHPTSSCQHQSKETRQMSTVLAEMSMSLDGYVADPNDGVDALHAWYSGGDVETPTGMDGVAFRTSAASAQILRNALANSGALITGRRNFDIAGGWGGSHPLGVPVFVVTHSVPDGWPRDGAPFTFLDSVEEAISAAQAAAGDKAVVIASPSVAQQALALGLLDEIAISLVPVLLGDGIPFFVRRGTPPIALSDPRVITGAGVTHLIYRVNKPGDRSTHPEGASALA